MCAIQQAQHPKPLCLVSPRLLPGLCSVCCELSHHTPTHLAPYPLPPLSKCCPLKLSLVFLCPTMYISPSVCNQLTRSTTPNLSMYHTLPHNHTPPDSPQLRRYPATYKAMCRAQSEGHLDAAPDTAQLNRYPADGGIPFHTGAYAHLKLGVGRTIHTQKKTRKRAQHSTKRRENRSSSVPFQRGNAVAHSSHAHTRPDSRGMGSSICMFSFGSACVMELAPATASVVQSQMNGWRRWSCTCF